MSEAIRLFSGSFGRVALLDMDHSLVRHAHHQCHVLIKVGGTDSGFTIGDIEVPLADDNAVLINAWEPHSYQHAPGQPKTTILALYIEPTWLAGFRLNWASSGNAGFFTRNSGSIDDTMRKEARELSAGLIHAPSDIAGNEARLGRLMISVIERFTDWQRVGTGGKGNGSNVRDWRIRRAISLIDGNVGQPFSIDELADATGMSRANFFRRFEAEIGLPPRVFQNVLRVEQALRLTVNTNESLRSLSERLGFPSQAHFTRFFRNHTAIAPSQYRSVISLCRSEALVTAP